MDLTNEEKKKIADAATLLMQVFCEYRMAEDRLNMMNLLSGSLMKMALPEELIKNALAPFMTRFQLAKTSFFENLGIGEDNKEFWEYNEKMEKAKVEEPEGV